MASALTILFLGCWLAGQSRAQGHAGSTTARGTNSTLLGTTSASSSSLKDAGSTPATGTSLPPQETTAAHTQPGGSESDLSGAIVSGVIVGAAGLLLLLLLLGFLCRRRTRARERPASRQSRESEAATTVYALVGHGKQQDVPEPDPGAEGLTYAELDHQALQTKREAPAPAPEPVLYATVSRSQGAPLLPSKTEPGRVTEMTGQGARPPESDAVTHPGEQAQLTVFPYRPSP
ncbi:uncharacterized protein LOC142825589 [Pelodiscus sinensis]|uniref:uncharacterized protein LOC142825589 n=1 Tax=Pelodiscus sinensis TaxID=13735 RepID=UPI003F6CBC9F